LKYEIPSGDLKQLGIPSGNSFFEAEIIRSLLAIFFNQKPKNLFCKSVNLESHLAIPFNRLLDVVPPDGRV
jgi:hypothetical protein